MPGSNGRPPACKARADAAVYCRLSLNPLRKRSRAAERAITSPGTIITSSDDWSPQGNAIVFSRRVSADRRQSLWIVHADGSGLRELHVEGQPACGGPIAEQGSRSCFHPRWSPDGTKIAFSIFSDATGENVYTANSDGTHVSQVTHGGDDELPDWGTHPLAR